MPLQATSGAASYDAFGGGVAAVPNYIEDVFSTYLYTGNGTTGQTINNGIDLTEGGLVAFKNRADASWDWIDTERGGNNSLRSNSTGAQYVGSSTEGVTAFNSNGFTLGANIYSCNGTSQSIVSWTFRKQPKFFDVVTYTGTGSLRTVSHSLGSVPGCIIIKNLSDTDGWLVYHRSIGATKTLSLNTTGAAVTDGNDYFNDTEPTSTQFTVNIGGKGNQSGNNYVAYLFAHNAGGFGLTGTDNVISCGSFTGSASGTTVNLGWEPQWVLIKRSSGNTDNWRIYDNMRGMTASNGGQLLYADTSGSETTNSRISVNATGFGFVDDAAYGNIYIAIRRGPMKVPTSGTSVFSPNISSGSVGTVITTNFPVDMQINAVRDITFDKNVVDRLRGVVTTPTDTLATRLRTNLTNAEGDNFYSRGWNNTGFQMPTTIADASDVFWSFRRAPSFFDVVCYTNNATGASVQVNTHNLGVRPELAITKVRNDVMDWFVGSNIGNTTFDGSFLNTTAAADIGRSYTSSSAYKGFTATTFSVGSSPVVGAGGLNVVTYLFATCAGVSKCGTFTGNGSSQTINCGFTGGARFVMIKATSTTGDWMVADSARGIVSGSDPYLELNNTNAEVTGEDWLDTDSTGFVVNEVSGSNANTNGVTYIFLAIA